MTQLATYGEVGLSGREALEAVRDGRVAPPAAGRLLGFQMHDVGDGWTVLGLTPGPAYDNGVGLVHGGILATLADTAAATAVVSQLPLDVSVVTSNLTLTYQRPVPVTAGPIRCEGRVVHRGRRVAHAEATITGSDGRVHVRAVATVHLAPAAGSTD